MNVMVETVTHYPDHSVAVVGWSGRFPKAPSVDALWQLINDDGDGISRFDPSDCQADPLWPGAAQKAGYVAAKGVLDDIEQFDAEFFGLSNREAQLIDPQQRLFLECCWEALEIAGIDPDRFSGRIGLVGGAHPSTYLLKNLLPQFDRLKEYGEALLFQSNQGDQFAARVAYKLNLGGPVYTVQTACSTSLVAVHLASQSLLNGEADIMLAGGACVTLPIRSGYVYEAGGIRSSDGHCRPFDAAADGTVFGDGAGVVVLKRLSDAVSAGDNILGVVRGSAINNDGSRKMGYTAPGLAGQASVIGEALDMAEVTAETIDFVETHGTGTQLGDPIEIEALTEAYRQSTASLNYCALGSLKAKIGHLDTAAGVAGLIKAILCLRHGRVTPNSYFREPNKEIQFVGSPFFIERDAVPLKRDLRPFRAGVSAFGIGGTNAHLVLEEAPEIVGSERNREFVLVPLSARTPEALQAAIGRLASSLDREERVDVEDIAFTLATGRKEFAWRRTYVVQTDSIGGLTEVLRSQAEGAISGSAAEPRDLIFSFGATCDLSNRSLDGFLKEPAFATAFSRCRNAIEKLLGKTLEPAPRAHWQETVPAALATFASQYALANLWLAWGVSPRIIVGRGNGLFPAASIAGAMEVEDALRLLERRHRRSKDPSLAISDQDVRLRQPNIPILFPQTAMPLSAADLLSLPEIVDDSTAISEELVSKYSRPAKTVVLGIGDESSCERMSSGSEGDAITLSSLSKVADEASPVESAARTLGTLWQMGVAVDWTGYFEGQRRRRVMLPTYPFQRQRCWIEPEASSEASRHLLVSDSSSSRFEAYTPRWKRAQPASGKLTGKLVWLIFATSSSLSEQLVSKLENSGQIVTVVQVGAAFRRLEQNRYELNPESAEDYCALLIELRALVRTPSRVIYLWADAPGTTSADGLGSGIARNFLAPVLLAKALIQQNQAQPIRLLATASNLHDITGSEALSPIGALLQGPMQVFAQEVRTCSTCLVDIDARVRDEEIPQLAERLIEEINGDLDQKAIAIRGRYRLVQEFERRPEILSSPQSSGLRKKGVYLVTGGLGGIGRVVATWLASTAQARIVLVQRSPVKNPSAQPGDRVSLPLADLSSDEAFLQELEKLGSEVFFATGDVADLERMREIAADTERRFGPVNGVFHTAGIAGGGLIHKKDQASMLAVLSAKVRGTNVLEEVFGECELDFAILFSSINALAGGIGQVDYCAANAYLDAFSHWRYANYGRRTVSINWPAWRDVGMAARDDTLGAWREESLAFGIDAQEATAVLNAAIVSETSQFVVSKRSLQQEFARYQSAESNAPTSADKERAPRPNLSIELVGPRDDVESELVSIWSDILGIENVGINDDFFELGGHSLIGMQMLSRIKISFGVDPSVMDLFETPTIAGLAALITQMIIEEEAAQQGVQGLIKGHQ